jgi:CheY-like chemotaxis protein
MKPAEARILIIDDEQANVLLLERLLSQAGYQRVVSTTDSRAR